MELAKGFENGLLQMELLEGWGGVLHMPHHNRGRAALDERANAESTDAVGARRNNPLVPLFPISAEIEKGQLALINSESTPAEISDSPAIGMRLPSMRR
jgi:hypothetical protein